MSINLLAIVLSLLIPDMKGVKLNSIGTKLALENANILVINSKNILQVADVGLVAISDSINTRT